MLRDPAHQLEVRMRIIITIIIMVHGPDTVRYAVLCHWAIILHYTITLRVLHFSAFHYIRYDIRICYRACVHYYVICTFARGLKHANTLRGPKLVGR